MGAVVSIPRLHDDGKRSLKQTEVRGQGGDVSHTGHKCILGNSEGILTLLSQISFSLATIFLQGPNNNSFVRQVLIHIKPALGLRPASRTTGVVGTSGATDDLPKGTLCGAPLIFPQTSDPLPQDDSVDTPSEADEGYTFGSDRSTFMSHLHPQSSDPIGWHGNARVKRRQPPPLRNDPFWRFSVSG